MTPPISKTKLKKYRNHVRKELHAQLDALLNGTTRSGDGTMAVIDEMVEQALAGFGFNVRVHSLHPDATTTRMEAPATVEAGPEIGLVRSDPSEESKP